MILLKRSGRPKSDGAIRSAFEETTTGFVKDAARATAKLWDGSITAEEWFRRILNQLQGGHTDAHLLGALLGGGNPSDLDAQIAGLIAADGQEPYLLNFLADIRAGRYGPMEDLSTSAIGSRLDLYALRLRGTANQAWTNAGDDLEQIHWRLGANDHCADCPEAASLGPYYPSTLAFVPGDGHTACRGNCTCWLERESGSKSFQRVAV